MSRRNIVPRKILQKTQNQRKVVQCALGALSNIAICERFQKVMCNPAFLKLVVETWDNFMDDQPVVTAACGLIANLAIDDESEDMLIASGVIHRVIPCATTYTTSEDIRRNCAAALSNLSHGRTFNETAIKTRAVECLYKMQDKSTDEAVTSLITNSLEVLGLDVGSKATSLHLAAKRGCNKMVVELLQSSPAAPRELNETCSNGLTAVDWAASHCKVSVINLLAAVGGSRSQSNMEVDPATDIAYTEGQKQHESIRRLYVTTIRDNTVLPEELCSLIVSCTSGIDRYLAA